VTQVEPQSLKALAQHVLGKVKPLGLNGVLMAGDPDQMVNRVATGTGVSVDPIRMRELGADCGILTDDYYLHVRMGAHAQELDFPALVVNHGVAEEWGIEELAAYLSRTFPNLDVFHIPQACAYTVVS
jgi:putative NIF3 family GTP cyclohydrolase 1 type 2